MELAWLVEIIPLPIFNIHCYLDPIYGVGDIIPQDHQLHFCIILTDWNGRPNETNEPISPDNNHLVSPAIDKPQKTGHIKLLAFCVELVGNNKFKSSLDMMSINHCRK